MFSPANPVERLTSEAGQHLLRTGRPRVNLCYAQSLDGSLAAARGRPLDLSGSESRILTHRLRAAHDAILVGVGTVISDNPRLNVRLVNGPNPRPVILDSRLRIPLESAALAGRPRIACLAGVDPLKRAALESGGAEILFLPPAPTGGVSLPDLLDELGRRGVHSLMVEGGAGVITSFLAAGLADEACITIAPLFVGGLSVVQGLPAGGGYPHMLETSVERCGSDWILTGKLEYPHPPV
jgi:3,4-dihydroxy 2-butanone 4-phosphate synthase/GTP cyclohydrolase II